jgi:hypothetical protein
MEVHKVRSLNIEYPAEGLGSHHVALSVQLADIANGVDHRKAPDTEWPMPVTPFL